MESFISLKIDDTLFQIYGDKYIYIPTSKSVVLADLHIGKVNHFRKNGIQVPLALARKNVERLKRIIEFHEPEEVIILGDLFHSNHNTAWENFKALRFHFSRTRFMLLIGNHDTFLNVEYKMSNIEVIDKPFKIGKKIFSHEPCDRLRKDQINIHGHIHPAVILKGKALQSMRLPCFFYSQRSFILPAFGEFTGSHRLKPQKQDRVFVCAQGRIFEANKRNPVKQIA